jgi:hypothetical protein
MGRPEGSILPYKPKLESPDSRDLFPVFDAGFMIGLQAPLERTSGGCSGLLASASTTTYIHLSGLPMSVSVGLSQGER